MEESSAIPQANIESLHPLDRGFDFALPYLINNKGMPTVNGIAMFSGTKMTGKLDRDQSRVYLLLAGSKNKDAKLRSEYRLLAIPNYGNIMEINILKSSKLPFIKVLQNL
jgi:hypothetical protein